MPVKKLTAPQARKIADAEARYREAKRALEAAKEEREQVRARYADRVPIGAVISAGGLVIKRRVQTSGPSFRLAAFLERHKLTAQMRPFVTKGSPFEVWDVRPGPG